MIMRKQVNKPLFFQLSDARFAHNVPKEGGAGPFTSGLGARRRACHFAGKISAESCGENPVAHDSPHESCGTRILRGERPHHPRLQETANPWHTAEAAKDGYTGQRVGEKVGKYEVTQLLESPATIAEKARREARAPSSSTVARRRLTYGACCAARSPSHYCCS